MANGSVTEAEGKKAFNELKPFCVQVMSSPSLESLSGLRERVSDLQMAVHPHLVDYVLLPVRTLLKRYGSSNVRLVESALKTMTAVLSKVKGVDSWPLVQELLVFLCTLLDPKLASEAGFTNLSEDVILAAVEALKALLLSLANSLRSKMASDLPLLGHCVSVLLATLQSYEAKALRRETLSAMLALSGVNTSNLTELIGHRKLTNQNGELPVVDDVITSTHLENPDSDDSAHILSSLSKCIGVSECTKMGGAFASFLPGVTMALTKLMTSDIKVGSSVTVLALLTWVHYVAMVMDNTQINLLEVGGANKEEESGPRSLAVQRSKSWCSATDQKLCILVQRVCVLVASDGWRVRMGLVGWAYSLLTHCYRSLISCMPPILEVLVVLSRDDYPVVSSTSELALTNFSELYSKEAESEGEESFQLAAIMEERLYSLASSLPRLLRSQNDSGKVSTLQLLIGYLKLLQSRVVRLVHSQGHLSRIIQALVLTVELDVSDIHILERLPESSGHPEEAASSLPPLQPVLRYVHFSSDHIEALFQQVCQLLGRHGSLPVIVDHLLEQMRLSSSLHGKELLLVLSHVLVGVGEKSESAESADEMFVLVEGLLEEMVAIGNWNRSRDSVGEGWSLWKEEKTNSSKELSLHSCLQLHVVSVCVYLLGASFKPLLQLVVYPLLQRLGEEDVAVATAAHSTLKNITIHCGYKSLSDLINDNADYLVNSVALCLRSSTHIQPLHVLQAILSHGDETVLLLIQDSIDELLLLLDVRQVDPSLVWPVLRTLAQSCERWRKLSSKNSSTTPASESQLEATTVKDDSPSHVTDRVTAKAIEEFFLQYHREKQCQENLGDISDSELNKNRKQDIQEGEGEEGDDPYNQSKQLSPLSHTIVEVMERCGHHMSTEPAQLRLIVLETLTHCLVALQDEQNTLLPEVHTIWSPFLPRLSDPAPPVARRAWQVMVVLCDVCQEFLRKRVVQRVWSPLTFSLESLARKSLNADKLYKQTAQCKLQQELLDCVGLLSLKLKVSTAELERLAHACLPYLHSNQPDSLQKSCQTCFRHLINLDHDAMWLLLEQLRSEGLETMPPSPLLRAYKLPNCLEREKYRNNVNILIKRTQIT